MSLQEKYGTFAINNIIFYDEEEYNTFLEKMKETYQDHLLKVNNEKMKGKGKFGFRTTEQRNKLAYLSVIISTDDEQKMSIEGYGHRRAIFPLEMYVRKNFDEGRIISYSARDSINRTDDLSTEIDDMLSEKQSFDSLCKDRLSKWRNGELPNPRKTSVQK